MNTGSALLFSAGFLESDCRLLYLRNANFLNDFLLGKFSVSSSLYNIQLFFG